jgi:hypothetical protein
MIADITPGLVRAWRAELVAGVTTATMIAKAYRLLHAVLKRLDDELIRRNPCRIRGAGEHHTPSDPSPPSPRSSTSPATFPPVFRQ